VAPGPGHRAAGAAPSPALRRADPAPPDENDYSIAALLRMGKLDYFTAGDMSGQMLVSRQGGYSYHDIETRVTPQVRDVDVYRVSHHGSSYASNSTLLAEMQPRVSIIQVADGNSNGHPTQSAVDRLLATSALYLTEHGNPSTNLRTGKVVGHVVVRTSTGVDYTVNGDRYVASDPARVDSDGDGYFVEADPDERAAYLRLRREDYTPAALDAWAERIAGQPWSEAYVFVKHETAEAPALASRLLGAFAASSLTYGGAKMQTAEASVGQHGAL